MSKPAKMELMRAQKIIDEARAIHPKILHLCDDNGTFMKWSPTWDAWVCETCGLKLETGELVPALKDGC